jgi:hypothetical protein
MKELDCYARTCVHNDKCACKKDCIDVENSQNVAKCMDYEPVGATNYSYETAEERCFGTTSKYCTDIHCKVKNCKYYVMEKCSADKVTITHDSINKPATIKCETYDCEDRCEK